MKKYVALLLLSVAPAAMAQAPADAQARAKEEAAARAAWAGKVASFQLCESQDRVAENYFANAKAAGKPVGEPVPTPDCVDPGPFSFLAPGEKPLEVSGAHSPAPTAATPPSTNDPASDKQPPQQTSDTPAGPAGSTPDDKNKPLEVSGAHSPAATANTPPSTNDPASDKQPPEQAGGTPEGSATPAPAQPAQPSQGQPGASSSQTPAEQAVSGQTTAEVPAAGGERVVPEPSASGHTGNTPTSPGTASSPSSQ